MVVEEVRRQRQGRGSGGSGSSNGMEMPWAQCFGKTLMMFVFAMYVVIAAALLMLVVAAGFEKSWKTGLMVSLILLFWGSVGGCGLHWILMERRERIREERRRGSDGGRVEEGRVEEGAARGMGGRDSGLGTAAERRQSVEGPVRYESLHPQMVGDGVGSIQEAPGDGERRPLLRVAGARAGIP